MVVPKCEEIILLKVASVNWSQIISSEEMKTTNLRTSRSQQEVRPNQVIAESK
jgi:hypothetical protein